MYCLKILTSFYYFRCSNNEEKNYYEIKNLYMKSLNQFDLNKLKKLENEVDEVNFDVIFYQSFIQFLDQMNNLNLFS